MVTKSMIIGDEAANSYVKSFTMLNGKPSKKIYPNTTRVASRKEEGLLGSSGLTTYMIDGVKYVVGETRNVNTSSGRQSDRYSSHLYKVEMLISIAQHAYNGARIKLVTGLPATHYDDGESIGFIEESLRGTHTVYVGTEKRTFEIIEVKVLLQPIGTLMYYLFDEMGNKKRPHEMSTYKLIVDIGWGTTDLAVVNGMNITETYGIDTAMLEAYKTIKDRLEENVGGKLRGVPNYLFLEERLRDADVFSAGGMEYDASKIKPQAFEETASTIISKIANEGIKLSDFDKVIFTGGGVAALAPHISKFLADVNATRVARSQEANAIGFYTYGYIKMM